MPKSDFIFSLTQLKSYLTEKGFKHERINLPSSKEINEQFFMMIPKYYIDLINWYDKKDPLRKMVITSNLEADVKTYELKDPISDQKFSPVPGIIHRHADRCLLMLTNICPVHCRFCFRKNLLSGNKFNLQKSFDYIKSHNEIREVILSGGDPFMFTDHFMELVLKKIKEIPHIKTTRFHTRTPAVYPQRITSDFIKILSIAKPSTIAIHINHPREITKEFKKVVDELKKVISIVVSQTVLLKEVNDHETTLAELFYQLVEIGIKPYYLHHLDLTAGTDYFRNSIDEGILLMKKLRKNISGISLPTYVLDVPGGYGKIPVESMEKISQGKYKFTTVEGESVFYDDPVRL